MSTFNRVCSIACVLSLGGCLEKMDAPPTAQGEDGDGDCMVDDCDADPDQGDTAPEVEMDPDPLYLERAQAGLAAWNLEMGDAPLAALRTMGDAYTAHNPTNWVTVAEDDCVAEGVGEGLRADCPLDEETIGVCETRYYPDTGEIVDTTLVVYAGFQESDASDADKLAVFVHEAGHCLGLRHSDDEKHVMYPTTSGADMPAPDELAAIGHAYLPSPQAPPKKVADKFFAKSSAGATVRMTTAPSFTISGSIGTEADRSFDPPEPGARLRGPVAVERHVMRADGSCDHGGSARG